MFHVCINLIKLVLQTIVLPNPFYAYPTLQKILLSSVANR